MNTLCLIKINQCDRCLLKYLKDPEEGLYRTLYIEDFFFLHLNMAIISKLWQHK